MSEEEEREVTGRLTCLMVSAILKENEGIVVYIPPSEEDKKYVERIKKQIEKTFENIPVFYYTADEKKTDSTCEDLENELEIEDTTKPVIVLCNKDGKTKVELSKKIEEDVKAISNLGKPV